MCFFYRRFSLTLNIVQQIFLKNPEKGGCGGRSTSLWFPAVVAGCLQVQMRLKRGLGVRRHGYLGRLCVADLGQTKES